MNVPDEPGATGADRRQERRQTQRRRRRRLAIVLAIVFVVFVAASLAAAAYTERSSFCEHACHEMEPYGATWEHSAHKDVACVKCHIKPGAVELVEAKGSALREVWVHFAGQVKAPIAVTKHVPNATCESRGCHPEGSVKDPVVLGSSGSTAPRPAVSASPSPAGSARPSPAADAAPGAAKAPPVSFSHEQHPSIGLCIDCHSQVVHRSVPGKPYIDPTTMAYCLRCHDGKAAPSACQTCHSTPHAQRGLCTACHSLGSWASTFEHPVPVGPQHKRVVCEKCHSKATPTTIGYPAGCVSCHAKRHKTVTTTLCAKCHVPTHWKPSTFKHPRSGCTTCHTRAHPDRGSCLRCHTTSSWASHFDHPVALGGVHASFACEKCHTNGLGAPGRSCTSCHGSQHGGLTDCQRCHTTSAWVPSTFSHPPAGEHGAGSFACSACHPGGSFASAYCSCHGGSPPSGD